MPQKVKKRLTRRNKHDEEEEGDLSQTSSVSNMEDDLQLDTVAGPSEEASLGLILTELREMRRDFSQQLNDIREDFKKIDKRMEEAEERIETAETRIQTAEEVLAELVKLQKLTEAKLTDLEGRSRRDNVRIHGVKEGAEEGATSVTAFVETLLMKGLELPPSTVLNIERAHRALATKPPAGAPPRSLVVKFSSYRMKEEVIKRAWQKKGFDFQGKRIHLDHDYAPELLRKRRAYTEAKAALKEKNIRFQTPFLARLRVHYEDGPVMYNSVEEATADMAERGLPVTVMKKPTSLLDQINRMTWRSNKRRGDRETTDPGQGFKERLQAFRCQNDG